ncbi:MAG: cation:dicarboxylase symporter family transporter, partial [Alphaproteobacteria bacterium]|nr:cation:dicarboxylase symporter family transporter [Alphaproteobacteria bacterium]
MADTDIHPLQALYPRSLKHLSHQFQGLIRGRLWLKVLIAMALGLLVGFLIGPTVGWVEPRTASTVASWLAIPGQLFLALVQMIVIPLVFASIIRGIAASEGVEQLRRLGLRVVLYFVGTTSLAITIGLAVAQTIKPGRFVDSATVQSAL